MRSWLGRLAVLYLLGGGLLAARQIRVEWLASSAARLREAVESEQSRRIFPAASAARLLQLAEMDHTKRLHWLRAAAGASPRASGAWIALGLEYERLQRMPEAEQALLEAARLDRQYLPAWTLANFYFRRQAQSEFWRWAARAAALAYDKPLPLIRLADFFEPDPERLLQRLEAGAELTRVYLDYLIGERRLELAGKAARVLESFGDPSDRRRLEDLEARRRAARKALTGSR